MQWNKLAKENKAYIEALKELDRTGKLRKINYKKRVNFTVDEDLMNRFRKYCNENSLNMSKVVERLIRKEIYKKIKYRKSKI